MSPPTHPVAVLLVLADGGRVLLVLREGTGYADGMWNLPSGKLEPGEDVLTVVIRETREEIGFTLTGTTRASPSPSTTATPPVTRASVCSSPLPTGGGSLRAQRLAARGFNNVTISRHAFRKQSRE